MQGHADFFFIVPDVAIKRKDIGMEVIMIAIAILVAAECPKDKHRGMLDSASVGVGWKSIVFG